MKIKELRAILDAIAKEHNGEDTEVAMFSDNSHGSGAWEFANVDHIVEFPDDGTIYLAADFDYYPDDPYDGKVKAKYTDVSDALKGKWAKKFESPYCDDPECDEECNEEQEDAELKALEEKTEQGILDFYKDIAKLTGEEPPKTIEDCMWNYERDGDFYEKLKELDNE